MNLRDAIRSIAQEFLLFLWVQLMMKAPLRDVTRGSVFLNNSKTIFILVAFWVSVNIIVTKRGNFYLGL